MIYSQTSVFHSSLSCRCPSPWEFYSRMALIPSLPSKVDLTGETWPCLEVRRESEEVRQRVVAAVSGGTRAGRKVIPRSRTRPTTRPRHSMGMETLTGDATCCPFATGTRCRESSPSTCYGPWTGGNDLDNCMGSDYNGFQKPWLNAIWNNDLYMHT